MCGLEGGGALKSSSEIVGTFTTTSIKILTHLLAEGAAVGGEGGAGVSLHAHTEVILWGCVKTRNSQEALLELLALWSVVANL